VAYYVPLGPRGLILRFGTWVVGHLGGLIYRRDRRRRRRLVRDRNRGAAVAVRGAPEA